jgi:hypothetical protein
MPIPELRPDGYLPAGCHSATEEEVASRFGRGSARRRALMRRVREWLLLARAVGARRFVLDGSFVTEKQEPGDLDAVLWLPGEFEEMYDAQVDEAVQLYEMLVEGSSGELFGVFSQSRWEEWIAFFSQTRELDGRRKGLVEIPL